MIHTPGPNHKPRPYLQWKQRRDGTWELSEWEHARRIWSDKLHEEVKKSSFFMKEGFIFGIDGASIMRVGHPSIQVKVGKAGD